MVRYLSVCSGIEAATVAWHDMGWSPVAFSEIEAFPSAVLREQYPETPNWGDMTKFQEWPNANVDLLVGGTPCQSFSVAGLRKGLADPRGNLALTYLAIADKYRPRWLVWENVPGVLSSAGGRDFGAFLGGLGQLGYGWAYRVLDAQYFGVAQRRRRVFVVGCLGDWRRAAAVLFERHSMSWNTASGEDPIKVGEVVGTVTTRTGNANDNYSAEVGHCIPTPSGPRWLTVTECERLQGFPDGYTNIPWRGKPESPDGPRYKALGNSMAVPVMRWIGRRIQEVDRVER